MVKRRGTALVLIATSLTTLLMFVGTSIDVGFWYTRKAQLQLVADMAVVAAMGAVDAETPVATQRQFITTMVRGIVAANGYDSSSWAVDPVANTAGTPNTYIDRTTVDTTQEVPKFFLNVLSSLRPTVRVRSVARGIRQPVRIPPCGFVAKNNITYAGAGNGSVDSFNSDFGGYNPTNLVANKEFDRSNAVGCANATITFNGNVAQFGSLYTYGNATITGGAALIDGSIQARGQVLVHDGVVTGAVTSFARVPRFTLDPVVAPANIRTVNDNRSIFINGAKGSPRISGSNLTANGGQIVEVPAGGTYYFTNVDVTGGAEIVITGDPALAGQTRIFLDGPFKSEGGVTFGKAKGAPARDLAGVTGRDLALLGMASSGEIRIGGGSKVVADIYAPNMDVVLNGQTHLFGRIRANNITIDGTAEFTFDEALGYGNVGTDTFTVRAHLVD